jgi:cell wall-associated NlpC family hydrolase
VLGLVGLAGPASAEPGNPSDGQIAAAKAGRRHKAAAAALRARAAEAQAQTAVSAFARGSYVDGSTSPGLEAALTSDGPQQVLERSALLAAADSHRTDVLARMTTAQQQAGAAAGAATAARTAISAALRNVGQMYAWGGGALTGPSEGFGPDVGVVGFDCSGLTRYAYAQAGITLPRVAADQYAAFPKASGLRAGDLVFYATDPSDPATIHHVAMYLGEGR